MTPEYEHEIAANLERAEQSIQAAKDLDLTGYHDFAASRAYYAAFYGATGHIKWHQMVIKWGHTLISDYIIANKRQFCTLSVMTRQRHIEFEVAYYHVLSRGNERRDIFTDNDDRISFLEI